MMNETISSIFFLALLSLPCTASDIITPSKSIKDPEFIISQGGVFRLGFFGFPNSTNRYVGIWYNHIPERAVVWVANGNNPLKDSSGIFQISKDGNLVILNRQQQILWTTNVSNPVPNTTAQILDSGNLVLKNATIHLWESFQHPSDSHLPNMKLSTDLRTGLRVRMRSWKSPSDPSDGNFTSTLEPLNIPELVIWNNDQLYFRSGPWNGQIFIGIIGVKAVLSDLNSVFRDGFTIAEDADDKTYSATFAFSNKSLVIYYQLNSQGRIAERVWDAAKREWDSRTPSVQSDCDVYGKCGSFGICNSKKPSICSCLKGFEPKNLEEWKRENWSGGCVRTTPLQCKNVNNRSEVGKKDGFLKLDSVKVPAFPERSSTPAGTCGDQCLKNCSCLAHAYDAGIGCMLWSGNLTDIQKFPSQGVDLYIRVASSELDKKKDMSTIIIVVPVIAGIIIVTVSILLWCCIAGRKRQNKDKLLHNIGKAVATFSGYNLFGVEDKLQQLPLFTFKELQVATDNFDRTKMLGQGGFGAVYRGTLQDGKEIAVKRLSRASTQGLQEFMNEVMVISKLQHRNLVRLLGCCAEKEEKMLVYEYMPNKSLDALLFDPLKQELLDWKKRFNIIEGISRGLLYLHRDSRLKIIHRDLKASNVLLDEELIPKISDFGLAKIFGGDENQANTNRIVGTYGYMSPEYAMQGKFSEKSDVFSFGILLLEIVSGRKNSSFADKHDCLGLLGHAWNLWKDDNLLGLAKMAVNYESSSDVEKEILRCIHVGLLCVQDFAKDRPTMSSVVSMLNSEIVDLPPPNQPAFTERLDKGTDYSQRTADISLNDVTFTEFDTGR